MWLVNGEFRVGDAHGALCNDAVDNLHDHVRFEWVCGLPPRRCVSGTLRSIGLVGLMLLLPVGLLLTTPL